MAFEFNMSRRDSSHGTLGPGLMTLCALLAAGYAAGRWYFVISPASSPAEEVVESTFLDWIMVAIGATVSGAGYFGARATPEQAFWLLCIAGVGTRLVWLMFGYDAADVIHRVVGASEMTILALGFAIVAGWAMRLRVHHRR